MRKIIFVCHGNICRSVAAEFIAKQLLKEKNNQQITVISRATSREEIGNDIYPPMKKALLRHGVPFIITRLHKSLKKIMSGRMKSIIWTRII